MSTHREALVCQPSRSKNHVQCLIARLLLQPPCKVLWTRAGTAGLKGLERPSHARRMLDGELRQIGGRRGAGHDHQGRRVSRLLMTIPGVYQGVALVLLAAMEDVGRFRDGDHAASDLELVPTTKPSGRKCSHSQSPGRAAPRRGLLTQAAQHASRQPGGRAGRWRASGR